MTVRYHIDLDLRVIHRQRGVQPGQADHSLAIDPALWRDFAAQRYAAAAGSLEQQVLCLEQCKRLRGGREALLLAWQLADLCQRTKRGAFSVDVPDPGIPLRTLDTCLRGSGIRLRGMAWRRLRDQLAFSLAALVAAAAQLLFSVVRPTPGSSASLRDRGLYLAVHPETSNRTRHALALLSGCADIDAVLLIGRPRRGLAAFRRDLDDRPGAAAVAVLHPVSLWSTLCSAGQAAAMLRTAFAMLESPAPRAGFRQRVAEHYRLLLGCSYRAWWRRHGARDATVIYGHTGLADSSQLESAQQSAGCRTVHLLHGLAVEGNFNGLSSLALMRCGFDAGDSLNRSFYAATVSRAADRPRATRGGEGVMLYTNYLHPAGAQPPARSVQREEAALLLAESARGTAGEALYFRPHPAAGEEGLEEYAQLCEWARERGWSLCDNSAGTPPPTGVRVVLCTASTAIVDILRSGQLPIMLRDAAPIEHDALKGYPLAVTDPASLLVTLAEIRNPEGFERMFERCWQHVLPAASAGPGDLPFALARL